MSALTDAGLAITIDEKEYTFSPLRYEDVEWLELKLQSRAIEAGRQSLPADMPAEQREAEMRLVLETARKIDLLSSLDALFTMTGLSWMMWRMVRRNHPEVTLDVASEWVRDADVQRLVRPQLQLLMGLKKKQSQVDQPPTNGSSRKKSAAKS